jgi:cysteine-S-conjugate beta-lyase
VIDLAAAFHDLDLDALHRRRGNKWSRYPTEILPAWVADMDYPLAPVIADALRAAITASDVGYPGPGPAVSEAFAARAKRLWDWDVVPSRVLLRPDVVESIERLIEFWSEPGDAIVVTTPIYPPFLGVTADLGRRVVASPLLADGGLDLDHLTGIFTRERPRIVLLCNPHNPTGHVFRRAELKHLADLVIANDAFVVSDEIHAELLQPPFRHIPLATLGNEIAKRTVTVTSASKPFNIAGLRCAQLISSSAATHTALANHLIGGKAPVGALGHVASLAAWTPAGAEWLVACVDQIGANFRHVAAWAAVHNVGFRLPEATYLGWLDFRGLEIGPNPAQWLLHHAHVALSPGVDFGAPGRGFARLNVATSPAILDKILGRMSEALAER